MKAISVAIPAHNEERSIYRTLKAIVESEIQDIPLEIAVCLSGCSDHTADEIERFKQDFPNNKIRIIEDVQGGKARALKLLDNGIENEIIIFLDADCSPKSDAIFKLYSDLFNSSDDIKIVSGNAIDPRYINREITPSNLIEAFNHIFWQRSPRNLINGQLFSARKGVIQVLPDDIKLDDVYLTLYYWNQYKKNNEAIQIQGSPNKIYEVVRYQKNIQSGKKQIKHYLKNKIKDFDQKSKIHYSQFHILLSDRNKYYSNVSYFYLIFIKTLINLGKIWGTLSQASWSQTKGSKEIVVD